jgi:hypothetical protein
MFGGVRFESYFNDKIPDRTAADSHWVSYVRWTNVVSGSRLMTTRAGRFGWVANSGNREQQIESGDLLCIVFGCSVPLVIRPCGEYHHTLGEAYVQGLMNGEAIQGSKLESRGFNTINITFS